MASTIALLQQAVFVEQSRHFREGLAWCADDDRHPLDPFAESRNSLLLIGKNTRAVAEVEFSVAEQTIFVILDDRCQAIQVQGYPVLAGREQVLEGRIAAIQAPEQHHDRCYVGKIARQVSS